MKNKLAAWIALGLIALVAAVCLAATNEVTKDVIEQQNVAAMQAAWQTLVPGASFPEGIAAAESEEGIPKEYTYAGVSDDETVGYVAQTAVQGYGGEIEVIVGTDTEGTITGINVGGANFSETAGLGAKAKDAAFTDQFQGKTVPLTINEDVDAITASTITSSAVVRGVNAAVENIAKVAGFTIETQAAEAGEIGDGRYAATTKGFAGPVYVEIQLDGADMITEIVIGDDQFAETSGYGMKAKEPDFYEQFIGKTGQLTLGEDIDAIAGATITSQAVVDAVNTAMLYATDPEAAAAAAESAGAFELPDVPDDALTETASRKGFEGPVAAAITIDPDSHELLRVEFGDDQWAETDGIGSRVLDDAFWQQFIGKTLPLAEDDIDLISGATVSSQAAFEAVNKAYYKLFPEEEATEAESPPAVASGPVSGTATASSKGFEGPVAAEITVEDDKLTAVTFGDDSFKETEGIGT
ncbi:FMN-binding protein, partial [Eubacteriales bacterium OttesenSCG-928-A19]|nr:FMN-binding protein [Eubacteriales bacterium OttesenSCG-928-A19]